MNVMGTSTGSALFGGPLFGGVLFGEDYGYPVDVSVGDRLAGALTILDVLAGRLTITITRNGEVQMGYDVGDAARISAAFKDISDAPADPTAVSFSIKSPSGDITSYTFGTDAELVQESAGNYYVDFALDEPGIWRYRFAGSGVVNMAEEGSLTVRRSNF